MGNLKNHDGNREIPQTVERFNFFPSGQGLTNLSRLLENSECNSGSVIGLT